MNQSFDQRSVDSTNENEPVPYFRPSITEAEIREVVTCLRSGWLTTGPRTRKFQSQFAKAVQASHALALNSCTAALHLAVRALGLKAGQGVLIPSQTFAATAEVVLYEGGVPILVDSLTDTLNIDLADADRKCEFAERGELPVKVSEIVGIMPVHFAGRMINMDHVRQFAKRRSLWVVEDAAHAFPAAFQSEESGKMIRCGEATADATCFSFYANKTITTGEGGMVVTDNAELAERIQQMSLHGLSSNAWRRFEHSAAWDYRIVEQGYKYNMTDIAAAIGLHQLKRAEAMRQERQTIARYYSESLADVEELTLPSEDSSRIDSWHLFAVRLQLESLTIDRNTFCEKLSERGIGFSVHWRPLHKHPLYEGFGWTGTDLPVMDDAWPRLVSLPIFAGMRDEESRRVVDTIKQIISENRVSSSARISLG
ncbi:UDP-4-amino-4-deoxy-L-arabinose--oxoglutarate aminotransferase [Planctomycetes bacterium CA13]|uniref:UDP-4-amino-4-deoxy-L-arabinose--oxoglutarate aminotransferase n=1 Tax=Novipirellula herctigrandis TaxID=2527986 RepID=A0A5C5Z1D0_9BACT|nr:UDP-4-amino-4-deoxy-L-arabinose--oxoglutarate aminotransferase [Planctomycetes bacterium CA13]